MSAASQMLEIPEVRARVSPLTVAEYRRLSEYNDSGRRTELIRGIVIHKMSKSPLHSSIARRLFGILQPQLPLGYLLLREDPLTLADSEPEPDLAIVRGSEADFTAHHPQTAALIIEIAVSSATEDRSLAELYAEAGVEEYWIVLPSERRVEVYRQPHAGAYVERFIVEGDTPLARAQPPTISVQLGELF